MTICTIKRCSMIAVLVLMMISLLALSACSSSYSSGSTSTPSSTISSTTTQAPAASSAVTIASFAFAPASLTVKVGTTVTWTNKDSTTHTVTSDNNVFSSSDLASNASYSFTFNTAGTFSYHCAIHTSMKGTITVQ